MNATFPSTFSIKARKTRQKNVRRKNREIPDQFCIFLSHIFLSGLLASFAVSFIRADNHNPHRSPFSAGQERSIAEHRNSDGSSSAVAICLWMRWSYERDLSSARADSFRRPL